MFSSPPPPPPRENFIHSILSYDSNIMLAAIISLFFVILFVLLLHIYAKWFLVQARHRSGNSISVSHVTTTPASMGLSRSAISSIPLSNEQQEKGLECIICLSLFEDEQVCRKLPKCSHAFHVDCIDMWLYSHSTCPICRAPVLNDLNNKTTLESSNQELMTSSLADQEESISTLEIIVDVPINDRSENENSLNVDDPLSVTSLAGSLRRMLSRNTSERRKAPPSANVN
ncbi:RING-H2 finger protein ATL2 [Nicotiana tabacum]|uniref:RING-type E3 ubiquitin transferase n=2 Tax=Nicotiana TaxID=4085 RepID=A0A1S3XB29_TOBAC|nr:PREDICTED: RING-H2 finger protein ATL63 [Nicotiana sylvestris]XP_016436963.1 PREDICTED: RING-H2 finger protein ATL63 [Nicotiana tabacum]